MTTSMFGAPLGFRTYDEDQAKLAEMASLRDLRAGQTRHQDALSGLNQAQADVMRRKQTSDEVKAAAMQKAAAGMSPTGAPAGAAGDPLAEAEGQLQSFGRMAGVLAAGGQLEDATKVVQQVASGLNSISNARNHAATQQKTELETQVKKLRLVQEVLSGVSSPQTHANAVMGLQANPLLAGEELPPALRTYNPGALRAFLSGSPAEIKKRELQLKEIDEGRKQEDSKSLRALRTIQGNVAERRATAYEQRASAVEKAGGKVTDIGTTTEGELKAVRAELRRQGIELDPEDKGAAAQSIAEQARALWKGTGRSPDEARAYAISEAVRRGEIKPGSVTLPIVGETQVPGMAPTYKPKAGSVSKPLALPTSAESLVPGEFYVSKSGVVKQYTKNGWRGVTQMKRQVVGGPLADADEE